MKRIARIAAKGIILIPSAIMTAWAFGAIYYSNLPWQFLRTMTAIVFPIVCVWIFIGIRPFRRAVLIFLGLFAAVLVWWLLIPASNNRDWQPDLNALAAAEFDGDKVTIHNIRDCDYRTKTDFTVSYYDKTFDLSKLQGVDVFIGYWGSPMIAHPIMSFCFEEDQHLCISIETRKEVGEGYSAVKGFFKQYELIYIVADERDLIRVRTNVRKETLYLYRLNAKPQLVRQVLLDYLKTANDLSQNPEWYNALTQNCTTTIRGHTAPYTQGKMSWKLIINGYMDTLLYERKAVDTSLPFEKLKEISCINDRALQAGDSPDFSRLIREGLPERTQP